MLECVVVMEGELFVGMGCRMKGIVLVMGGFVGYVVVFFGWKNVEIVVGCVLVVC